MNNQNFKQECGLSELIEAFDTIMLMYIGVVSGVFSVIAEHEDCRPEKIASILGYQGEHIEAYCKAATAYGLLEQLDDGLQLSKFTTEEQLLTNPSVIWRGHRAYLLSLFPKVLRGKRVEIDPYICQLESKGCSRLASSYALSVLKRICPITATKCDILDLGAGQGTYLVDLLKLHPESLGVGVEIDEALVRDIERQLRSHGLADRGLIICGDVRAFETERVFDLVLLNSILHYLTTEERSILKKRSFHWLREGRYLVILEQLMPETLDELKIYRRRTILNLEFKVVYGTGLPSFTEIATELSRNGFVNIQTHSIDPTGTSAYILARKVAA